MKYDVNKPLCNWRGDPLKMSDAKDAAQATLRDVLEFACVNAPADEFRNGKDKWEIHRLLQRVHDAKETVSLEAADVELLKKVVGLVLPVVAVGAVYEALESASAKAPVTDVKRDGNVAEITQRP
jgi:hypothetical protein